MCDILRKRKALQERQEFFQLDCNNERVNCTVNLITYMQNLRPKIDHKTDKKHWQSLSFFIVVSFFISIN